MPQGKVQQVISVIRRSIVRAGGYKYIVASAQIGSVPFSIRWLIYILLWIYGRTQRDLVVTGLRLASPQV